MVLLVAVVFRPSRVQSSRSWEYSVEIIPDFNFVERMHVLGKKHWEMVSATHTSGDGESTTSYEVIFKRAVSGG